MWFWKIYLELSRIRDEIIKSFQRKNFTSLQCIYTFGYPCKTFKKFIDMANEFELYAQEEPILTHVSSGVFIGKLKRD